VGLNFAGWVSPRGQDGFFIRTRGICSEARGKTQVVNLLGRGSTRGSTKMFSEKKPGNVFSSKVGRGATGGSREKSQVPYDYPDFRGRNQTGGGKKSRYFGPRRVRKKQTGPRVEESRWGELAWGRFETNILCRRSKNWGGGAEEDPQARPPGTYEQFFWSRGSHGASEAWLATTAGS